MYLLLARCVLLMSVKILEQLSFAVGIVFQLFQQIPYSIFTIPFLTVSIQLFFLFLFGFFMIIMNTKLANKEGSLLDVFCIRIQHLSMKESVHTLQVRTRGLTM